jgi:hypothetical protein
MTSFLKSRSASTVCTTARVQLQAPARAQRGRAIVSCNVGVVQPATSSPARSAAGRRVPQARSPSQVSGALASATTREPRPRHVASEFRRAGAPRRLVPAPSPRQLRSSQRRSCSPQPGAAPPTPDARPGTTSAVSRHDAGSSVGSTPASTMTTGEPGVWLGTRSKRPPQSPRRRCCAITASRGAVGSPEDRRPTSNGAPLAAARRPRPSRSRRARQTCSRKTHISLSPARMVLDRVGLTSSARIPFVRRAHTRRPRYFHTTGTATRARPPRAVSNPASPSVRTLVRSEGREPGRPWTSASARAGER